MNQPSQNNADRWDYSNGTSASIRNDQSYANYDEFTSLLPMASVKSPTQTRLSNVKKKRHKSVAELPLLSVSSMQLTSSAGTTPLRQSQRPPGVSNVKPQKSNSNSNVVSNEESEYSFLALPEAEIVRNRARFAASRGEEERSSASNRKTSVRKDSGGRLSHSTEQRPQQSTHLAQPRSRHSTDHFKEFGDVLKNVQQVPDDDETMTASSCNTVDSCFLQLDGRFKGVTRLRKPSNAQRALYLKNLAMHNSGNNLQNYLFPVESVEATGNPVHSTHLSFEQIGPHQPSVQFPSPPKEGLLIHRVGSSGRPFSGSHDRASITPQSQHPAGAFRQGSAEKRNTNMSSDPLNRFNDGALNTHIAATHQRDPPSRVTTTSVNSSGPWPSRMMPSANNSSATTTFPNQYAPEEDQNAQISSYLTAKRSNPGSVAKVTEQANPTHGTDQGDSPQRRQLINRRKRSVSFTNTSQ